MGQKRTPHLVATAKRMRAEGASYADIAAALSKPGRSVSKAAVVNWLKDPAAASSAATAAASSAPTAPVQAAPAPLPAPPEEPDEPEDEGDFDPAQLTRDLARALRRLQREEERCRRAGDVVGAQRATKALVQLAGTLQRHQARQAAKGGDTLQIRVADVEASAARAVAALHQAAERVIAESATWPRCPTCGQGRGDFAPGDKSPIRVLFERVARRGA